MIQCLPYSLSYVLILLLILLSSISTTTSENVSNPSISNASETETVITSLKSWLVLNRSDRPEIDTTDFGTKPLTKETAQLTQNMLWEDHQQFIRTTRQTEWEGKQITWDKFNLKFDYKHFGEKPLEGWSLYISLHGGGNTPARVNDAQWRNQIRLYEPDEGIYLAPRAPTNTWNLWHLPHIDTLFDRLIETMIVLAEINPNRVYVMGYSAGGDGVYQLAPRMADRWAAAAMMAGHPNDANPLSLRNIGFTLHVGENDSAYKRNEVAKEWQNKLKQLHEQDPQGYHHNAVIHKDKGHWMDREDQVALDWMAQFERNPIPTKVVWKQDDVTHSRFYWLAVPSKEEKAGTEIIVSRKGQTFTLEKVDGLQSLTIRLNDKMVNMDKPVTVTYEGNTLFKGLVPRLLNIQYQTLHERGDPELIFNGELKIITEK